MKRKERKKKRKEKRKIRRKNIPSCGRATLILSSPDGHLGCLYPLAGVNSATGGRHTPIFAERLFSVLLGKYRGVGLLGGKGILCLMRNARVFPTADAAVKRNEALTC